MLTVPKNGDNILSWARNATREINSNIIHNGVGVKITRTPNGTNLVVQPGDKNKVKGDWFMPFDVVLGEPVKNGQQITNSRVFRIMTCGNESNILYTIGKQTKRIRPLNPNEYEHELTIGLPTPSDAESESEDDSNVVYIVVKFNYVDAEEAEEDDKYFPHDYTYDFVTDIDTDDLMSDQDGFQMIPIAYIQAIKTLDSDDDEEDEGEDEGEDEQEPRQGTRDGEGGDEGDDDEGPTIGGAYRTTFVQNEIEYALVQMYHGDIHLFWKGPSELTTCSVGEVQSGEGGTFSVRLEQWDGSTETVRVCACDLACTSYIPAGTKIIAHPIETRYLGE